MFETLRYNLKHNRKSVFRRISAWFIFGIIILVFGFWGLNKNGQQGMGVGTAATVNGQSIPMARLNEAIERLRRDPRMQQYEQLGPDFSQKMMQNQALSQVVEMELVKQRAQKEHILTTDAEVRDTITAIPAFQENGQFKRENYQNYLTQTGKASAEFESEIRQEQALRRTVEMFRSALAPTALELAKEKSLADRKANVEFLKIPTETLVIPESIAKADVAAFLAKPENDQKAKDYYESHKKEYSNDEQVRARHILIKAVEGDKDSENRAYTKAQGLAKQLKANASSFAALAKANSDDPGSKDKGGELGFFSKGQMVPAFDKAAFSANVNEVSDPIKTAFGYHVIQVEEKRAAATRGFDEMKNEIAEKLLAKERSSAAIAKLETDLKAADSAGQLNAFAAAHNLKWEEAGAFSIESDSIPKVGASDDGVRMAFGLSSAKPIGEKLVRQGSTAFALRYKAVPAETKKAGAPEQNEDMVAAFSANRRSEEALRGWVESLRKNSKVVTTALDGPAGPNAHPFDQ